LNELDNYTHVLVCRFVSENEWSKG